jgi:hypothetical protein
MMRMEHSERMQEIKKLGTGFNINTQLLWYKHGSWLIEQTETVERQQKIIGNQYKEYVEAIEKVERYEKALREITEVNDGHSLIATHALTNRWE